MLDKGVGIAIGALVVFTVLGMLATQIVSSTNAETCTGTVAPLKGSSNINLSTKVPVTVIDTGADPNKVYPRGTLCANGAISGITDATATVSQDISDANKAKLGLTAKPAGPLAYNFETVKTLVFLVPIGIIVFLLMTGFNMYRKKYA